MNKMGKHFRKSIALIVSAVMLSAAFLSACSINVNINGNTDKKEERIVPSGERQQITKDFIGLMEDG